MRARRPKEIPIQRPMFEDFLGEAFGIGEIDELEGVVEFGAIESGIVEASW